MATEVSRESVQVIESQLRAGQVPLDQIGPLGERLARLSLHPRWEVRKAVAHAAQYLRHDIFHLVTTRLVADPNNYVREAALLSRTRRAEKLKVDSLQRQHGDLMSKWLSELESVHGLAARKAALTVAERYVELRMDEAAHEITRAVTAAELSLRNLRRRLKQEDPLDRDAAEAHASRAQARVRFLHDLVRSVTEFSRQVTPNFRKEDLREVLLEALSLVRDRVKASRRPVRVRISIEPGLTLAADRTRLVQAFSNVIHNSFEAFEGRRGPRRIDFEARQKSGSVVVAITDNAGGMVEEVVQEAFTLYSTSKVGGTGFGLPLAQKIVEGEHGGSIALASRKGAGTTVTITLPKEQEKRA